MTNVQPSKLFDAVECPLCQRFVVPKADHSLPWHDKRPPLREVCMASSFTLEEAKIIARDRAEKRKPDLDDGFLL